MMQVWLNMHGNVWNWTGRQRKMLSVTATELPRLMACNGSRLMGVGVAPFDTGGTTRDEGNAAHWLIEQVHGGRRAEQVIDQKAPNGVYITVEMVEHLEDYISNTRGAEIEVETSFGAKNWQINSRADAINYNPGTQHLNICELKSFLNWSSGIIFETSF